MRKSGADTRKDLARAHADVKALVRAVNHLTLENQELPHDRHGRGSVVVPFPGATQPRASPPAGTPPGPAAGIAARDGTSGSRACSSPPHANPGLRYDLHRLTRKPRQLEDWIDAAEDKGLRLVATNRRRLDDPAPGDRLFLRGTSLPGTTWQEDVRPGDRGAPPKKPSAQGRHDRDVHDNLLRDADALRQVGYTEINRPPPKPLRDAQMGGASFFLGYDVKPNLSWDKQVALMVQRGLAVVDKAECAAFLAANNYYRFSGYARYFQRAPHLGDDTFEPGTTFDAIRAIYEADEALRALLLRPLARAELLLRTHTAHVIAETHGPCGRYLEEDFYTDVGQGERTVEACWRDIERSKERHILRYKSTDGMSSDFSELPVWSAVESLSFGTLSKCIERGAKGTLADAVASSLGIAKAGFAYRVRSLVYLRNRCAHHSRLWHHSVIDAGPTPNNVRVKAKRLAGQFEPRCVLDVIASLDDMLVRSKTADPILPVLVQQHDRYSAFWQGLSHPQNPRDHKA